MLKKGHFPWYSPDLGLSHQAKTVFNQLGNIKQIPHMSNSLLELQLELQNPEVLPKTLALKLKQDPLVSAHVLKVAESLRRLRSPETTPIHSLEHAIVYMGLKNFGEILLSAGLRTMILPESSFNEKEFWHESQICGIIAEHLMMELKPKLNTDEVFLGASLCNIGKLITAFCFPSLASKISRDTTDVKILTTWRQAEHSYQFPDHCILGEIAATFWGLPEYVLSAARKHHDLPESRQGYPLTLTEITTLANQLTHWILLQPHRIETALLEAYRARIGMNEKQFEKMIEKIIVSIKAAT
jgi:HD-like signal output (HDOD) protein